MAGYLIDFKTMNNLDYHKKQLKYNLSAIYSEIKRQFPDDIEPNLSDPKYKEIIDSLPYKPVVSGGISKALGLKDCLLDLDTWEDFSCGWARADKIPEDSPLQDLIVDTPRGRMVQLNKSALKIDENGQYILPKKGQEKNRRLGTEFVFGMGQNLSAAMARLEIDDPEYGKRFSAIAQKVFEEKIIPELTKDALIRTGKDGAVVVRAAEILTTCFEHTENRDEKSFKHFHFDAMNTALGEDGKLYALCTDQIIKNKDKYSAIFMSHMKEGLEEEFGFKFKKCFLEEDNNNEFLEDNEKNVVSYDLTDDFVPEQVRDYMNSRKKEIEEHIKKQGKELSFLEREYARLETRNEKTELSHHELKEKWAKDFEQLDYTSEQIKSKLEFNQKKAKSIYEDGRLLNETEEERMIESFLRKHKDINFTEDQFKAHVIKQLISDYSLKDTEREAERVFSTQCLQMLSKEHAEFYKDLLEDRIDDPIEREAKRIKYQRDLTFTFKAVRQKDLDIVNALESKRNDRSKCYDREEVEKFIYQFEANKTEEFRKKNPDSKPFKFAKGQRQAIIDTLVNPGMATVIAGRAGAGKSTLVEAIKDFYETKGITMYGTSTSSTATTGLAESVKLKKGKALNAAQLIKNIEKGKTKLDANSVLCVDEAGMLDLPTAHKLITYCDRAGAKILLVGESEQLQAVGYGDAFRYIGEKFGLSAVKDINRQVDDWQKEMVENFASGRTKEAVKALYDNGSVVLSKTEDDRLKALVDDYVNMTESYQRTDRKIVNFREGKFTQTTTTAERAVKAKDKLVVATTNADVEKINQAIRKELKARGELPTDPEQTTIIKCKDKTEREFAIGDRVIFTAKTKTDNADPMSIDNSTTGSLVGFKIGKNGQKEAMKILTDDGKEVFLRTNKSLAIRHAFCTTVHKSQGQTKTKALYYVSPTMNSLHLAYVAMSRHKIQAKMYLSDEMAQKLVDKMEDREPTELMKKISTQIAQKHGYELNAEQLNSFKELRIFLNEHYAKYDDTKRKDDPNRHAMDDFTSIVESMSRTQFKKSTFDFEVLDGVQQNIYNSIKAEKELEREVKPEIKPEIVPEIKKTEEQKPEVKVEVPAVKQPTTEETTDTDTGTGSNDSETTKITKKKVRTKGRKL